jgi:hypothetical protein
MADAEVPGGLEILNGVQTELEALRRRHPGGDAQVNAILASTQTFADSYDDMNFTPP